MGNVVRRSIRQPIRESPTWDERWTQQDQGLITCWEVGRQLATVNPSLAAKAKSNELPVLDWKGGVEKKLKAKAKYGSLNYLATWQGLRDEDLHIDLDREVELVCSRTGVRVIFTPDSSKYANA